MMNQRRKNNDKRVKEGKGYEDDDYEGKLILNRKSGGRFER